MSPLLSFPPRLNSTIETPAFLTERGFSLRHAQDKDVSHLRLLYADTRAEEMSFVPWPQAAKLQFLDQQFDLQHQHYLKHYADADFLVIEQDMDLQGRYYLLKTAPDHLIIDICLMTRQRGLGIGRALIEASQHEAQALQRGMHLHVHTVNERARRLYEKLGFKLNGGNETHHAMRWCAKADA
jgi:ribosomal protein S18 acetylase RimI-like enzyme